MKRREFIQISAVTGIGLGLSSKLLSNSINNRLVSKGSYKAYSPEYSFNTDGSFNIRNNDIKLINCLPAFDNKTVNYIDFTIKNYSSDKAQVEYILNNGKVILNFKKQKNLLEITTTLEGFDKAPSYFCPLKSKNIINANRFFKQDIGYKNQSGIVVLDDLQSTQTFESYLMSGFLSENDETLTISADTYNSFFYKSSIKGFANNEIIFETGFNTENKQLFGASKELPSLILMGGNKPINAFTSHAGYIKRINGIGKVKNPQISWHTGENAALKSSLMAAILEIKSRSTNNSLNTIYINEGFCLHGDWLNASSRWTGGLGTAIDDINSNGFQAGVWIAPFSVQSSSMVNKDHKDWLQKDYKGEPYVFKETGSENWYLLDGNNSEVQAYIRDVFKTLKNRGASSFKIDMLGWNVNETCELNNSESNGTIYQSTNKLLQIIREAIGKDSYFLYVNGPLQLAVGKADGVGFNMNNSLISSLNKRNEILAEACNFQYLNNVLWQNHIYDSGDNHNEYIARLEAFLGTVIDIPLGKHTSSDQQEWSIYNKKAGRAYLPYWPSERAEITAVKFIGDRKSISVMLHNNSSNSISKLIKVKEITGNDSALSYELRNKNSVELGDMPEIKVMLDPQQSKLYTLVPEKLPKSLSSIA